MAPSILTIGHSRHPLETFLGLLQRHRVEVLVDARSQPFSRFSPGQRPFGAPRRPAAACALRARPVSSTRARASRLPSCSSPHFSRNALERAVSGASMRYLYLGDALGGRPKPRECYGADGNVDYDLVEQQDFYRRGIERLASGVERFRVCLMCAEEDPARCHRRLLIARTLVRRGIEVRHIRRSGAVLLEEELSASAGPAQLPLLGR